MRRLAVQSLEFAIALALLSGAAWAISRHYRPVRVAGGSMRPALAPGDLVVVDVQAGVKRNQIALFKTVRHGLVLHRVIAVRADGSLSTRGDANVIADFDAQPATAAVGPVVAIVPIGRLLERWRGSGTYATMTAQQNSEQR